MGCVQPISLWFQYEEPPAKPALLCQLISLYRGDSLKYPPVKGYQHGKRPLHDAEKPPNMSKDPH